MKTAKVIKNHYGVIVDSENPLTGVLNSNSVAWDAFSMDYDCLTCEEIIDESDDPDDLDWLECDSSHTRIHGDWIKDTKTGLYEPDKTGEFAMIENESTIQIVWSKTIKLNVGLCSPCHPGQADLDSTGDFKAYTLPSWAFYQD